MAMIAKLKGLFGGGSDNDHVVFPIDNIALDIVATDKWDVMMQMVSLFAKNSGIKEKDRLYEALVIREKQISTGLEHGIAMPHTKTDLVDRIVCGAAIIHDGVDFDSIDKQLSTIIIMILTPKEELTAHMQLMASVSKVLSLEENRSLLLQSQNKSQISQLLSVKVIK